MSINIYGLYVQTSKANDVKKFLSFWLSQTHSEQPTIQNQSNLAFDFFRSEIPSSFAVGTVHDSWVTVLHDSFEPQVELADLLSAEFTTTVIQAMGQSTVDSYFLSVHKDGRLVRKLHSGEDTDGLEQEGTPFPFEKEMLSRIDNETHFFDYNDIQDFCQNLGIEHMLDPTGNDDGWTVIRQGEKAPPSKESFLKSFVRKVLGK
ncbi:hypothetical protein A8F94_18955 [Bacillus sp. FJAT-27225]|uniref:hypothetical protein n=1 Tax=Bacillus sp. FJAT-27225 TaxID=1743144 RepID=UPI00080C2E72|nr:hypothetical protein [Bacillus sp. FJAT-27225]OCA83195.1 hypothetical protein A8F94_18955 [Bacillus sp. FJAT-27225]